MRGCASHCAACGRHFAGDGAFDLHRAGDHATGRRYCRDPHDEPRLTVAAEDGVCRISGAMDDRERPLILRAVTIWSETRNLGPEAQAKYRALRGGRGARIDADAARGV